MRTRLRPPLATRYALPAHDFRTNEAGRNSPEFRAASATYVDEITERGQEADVVSEEQFWQAFVPGGWHPLLTVWRDYQGSPDWAKDVRRHTGTLNQGKRGGAFEVHYNVKNLVDRAHGAARLASDSFRTWLALPREALAPPPSPLSGPWSRWCCSARCW